MTTNLPAFLPNSLIVKPKETASPSELAALKAAMGVTQVTTASQSGIQIWKTSSGNVEQLLSNNINNPALEYMELDYKITLPNVQTTSPTQQNLATTTSQTTPPNDPDFPKLWGLNNTGQTGGKPDADIDFPEALALVTGTQKKAVGVIDSGIDYTHPDLAANMWKNPKEIVGINGKDDDDNGYIDDIYGWDFANNDNDPMDDNEHGTHVAGTVGAVGNNNLGVIGVAPNNVSLVALKFLDASGSGATSNAILALDYATANDILITNNSWGGLLPIPSKALKAAITAFEEKGGLFVAAAGNSSLNTDLVAAYPASYPHDSIISVAATDHKDLLAYYSNYGKHTVDIAAPGSEIYSTLPGGNYGYLSGTSMASPHVAGAVALVWSQNPDLTAPQVKQKVMGSTEPYFNPLGVFSKAGRLNLFKALGGSTSNNNSNLGPIPLRIASTLSPAGAGNLTQTANAGAAEDILTGGPAADTLMLPFAESSVSAMDPVTYFGSETIDFLTEGGAMMNVPTLFSPAVNSAAPTLEKDVMPFTQAKGALAGNEALGIKSHPLAVAKTSPLTDSYLVGIYDATTQLGF
jgi:subtilisin family serine protease